MAQLYVKLDEKNYIKQYTNAETEGFKTVTIDPQLLSELGEYSDKMWVDENGLVRGGDDLPLTAAQKQHDAQIAELNDIKSKIEQDKSDINDQVTKAETEIKHLSGVILSAQQANVESSQKMAQMQDMLMRLQQNGLKPLTPKPSNSEAPADSNGAGSLSPANSSANPQVAPANSNSADTIQNK